jgi:hypothetical protein
VSTGLIVAGKISAVEMPMQHIWHRINGQEYERRWWGLAGAVQKMMTSARVGAMSVEYTQAPGSPIGILTARYAGALAGDQIALETVDIAFRDETFPIDMNPTYISLSDDRVLALKKAAEESNTGAPTNALEFAYYDHIQRGTTEYRTKLPTVTWTRTVGSGYSRSFDMNGVGSIFSTANLAGSIGAPVIFTIPTGNVGVTNGDGFTAGWMKDAQIRSTGDGKVQIVLAAEYGLWANDLYTFAT